MLHILNLYFIALRHLAQENIIGPACSPDQNFLAIQFKSPVSCLIQIGLNGSDAKGNILSSLTLSLVTNEGSGYTG